MDFAPSPMLVQYLVGLCCLKWDPTAVDVTVGDLVYDDAAEKDRDVDVTVTVNASAADSYAFKAYEVKREKTPLDVTEVEQLCAKLLDMPFTHRAIVSASGFTEGAKHKATNKGIELFIMKEWTRRLEEQFPLLDRKGTAADCYPMSSVWLCWATHKFHLFAREAKGPFSIGDDDALFDSKGKVHSRFATFRELGVELLLRSTELLFRLEPADSVRKLFPVPYAIPPGETTVGPAWPHTHTLDVSSDDIHVETPSGRHILNMVTINGELQWQRPVIKPLYYVVENVSDGSPLAGALITKGSREDHMLGLFFSPKTRDITMYEVRLEEKHRHAIRNLKLKSEA